MGTAWEGEGSLLVVVSTLFARGRAAGAGSRAHLRELRVPQGARLASQQGVVLQLLWESLPRAQVAPASRVRASGSSVLPSDFLGGEDAAEPPSPLLAFPRGGVSRVCGAWDPSCWRALPCRGHSHSPGGS